MFIIFRMMDIFMVDILRIIMDSISRKTILPEIPIIKIAMTR